MIVIRQFVSCSQSPTTKDFQIDNSIYNTPGMSLFDLDTYQCYQLTENQGTVPNTNYIGPYNNCAECNDEISGWEFQDCCNAENKIVFDITNLNVSSYVGKVVTYGGSCYNWTGVKKLSSGISVPMTTYVSCDMCTADNGPCPSPTPTPTPDPTTTPTPDPTGSPLPTTSITPTPTPSIESTPTNTPTNTITPTNTPTPTLTPTPSPILCSDCVCKRIVSLDGNTITYSYTDCYNQLQITGVIPPMGTVYQCVCFDNQTITFSDPTNIFVYANGGCADFQNCDGMASPTPTPTGTPAVTPTQTPDPTSSPAPTTSVTPTQTPDPTTSVTPTGTPAPTTTVTPTKTPGATPDPTTSVTPTTTPGPTTTPSPTSTPAVTPTPTVTPTPQPLTTRVYSCCGIGGQLFQLQSGVGIPVGSVYVLSNGYCYVGTTDTGSVFVVNDAGRTQVADCNDPLCNPCPSSPATPTPTQTPGGSPTSTPTLTPDPTTSVTPTKTPGATPDPTTSVTPTTTPGPTVTPSITISPTKTPTPTVTPSTGACVRDLITPKSVLINFNSGSDYTDCTVYTGTTSTNVTGVTYCTNMGTGQSCNLTGITATLLEIYIKISCDGCCENIYKVNLDDCCNNTDECCAAPTPTPTSSPAPTVTPTNTPTSTPGGSPTVTPTNTPTNTPTKTPTVTLTKTPGGSPTPTNTTTPTNTSTPTPTVTPTAICDTFWEFNGGTTGTGGHTTFSYTDCSGTLQFIAVGNGTIQRYCGRLTPTPMVTNDGDGTFTSLGSCP